jgi:4-O-beta-D-mannosyl-D-glucose phosphorylase
MKSFNIRLKELKKEHLTLLRRRNSPVEQSNGIIQRYKYPVLTAAHAPLHWRYDFNPATNPFLMERIGINLMPVPLSITINT